MKPGSNQAISPNISSDELSHILIAEIFNLARRSAFPHASAYSLDRLFLPTVFQQSSEVLEWFKKGDLGASTKDEINWAMCLLIDGQVEESKNRLFNIYRSQGTTFEVNVCLGFIAVCENDFSSAQTHFQELLKSDTAIFGADVYRLNSIATLANGYPEKAISYLEKAISIDPEFWEAKRNLANLLRIECNFPRAKKLLLQILTQIPHETEARRNLAMIHYFSGDDEECLREIEICLKEDPNFSGNWVYAGFSHYELNDQKSAAAAFRRANQLNPNVGSLLGEKLCSADLSSSAEHSLDESLLDHLRAPYPEGTNGILRTPIEYSDANKLFSALTSQAEWSKPYLPHTLANRLPGEFGHFSTTQDKALYERGNLILECSDLSVSYDRDRNAATIVNNTNYLGEKCYERPNKLPGRSSLAWFPLRDDTVCPHWYHVEENLPQVTFEEPAIFVNGSFNVSHFLADMICKLYHLIDAGMPIDRPVYTFPLSPFNREMTELFFPDVEFVDMSLEQPNRVQYLFKNAIVPANGPYMIAAHYMNERLNELGLLNDNPWKGKSVYLTRREYYPDRHRVENEFELGEALESEGFEIVPVLSLNLIETIQLFAGADRIVTPTGAQTIFTFFSPEGQKLLELSPNLYANNKSAQANACIGLYRGVDYQMHYGPTVFHSFESEPQINWLSRHDPEEIKKALSIS